MAAAPCTAAQTERCCSNCSIQFKFRPICPSWPLHVIYAACTGGSAGWGPHYSWGNPARAEPDLPSPRGGAASTQQCEHAAACQQPRPHHRPKWIWQDNFAAGASWPQRSDSWGDHVDTRFRVGLAFSHCYCRGEDAAGGPRLPVPRAPLPGRGPLPGAHLHVAKVRQVLCREAGAGDEGAAGNVLGGPQLTAPAPLPARPVWWPAAPAGSRHTADPATRSAAAGRAAGRPGLAVSC
mmetsp:Transcript_10062/g.21518  ORF Transcript_10062/g.21518 Transcript_10062/m.21518 type:complete len:237 (+) Transcript_10062:495-1205(+)